MDELSLAETPGLKTMTMNHYVARRLQFLSSTVMKCSASGRHAVFRVTRPRVCELGAKVPVILKLSDGRILHVDAPTDEHVPKVFVRADCKTCIQIIIDMNTRLWDNGRGFAQERISFR